MVFRFPGDRNFRTLVTAAVVAAAVLAAAVLAAVPAYAQNAQVVPPPKAQKKLPEAPSKLPKVGADRTRGLDFLFGALKAAPDEASAKHVEARIWAQWMQTPSDTAALLMLRAKAAMEAQKVDVALKLLDSVIKLRPDYVEAWNRRATLYYLKNDYTHSLEDIRQVLIREPRHFGALAGLGMIMQEIGDEKRALEAFRKALAVNPHLEKVPELVKTLTEKVEGRDIWCVLDTARSNARLAGALTVATGACAFAQGGYWMVGGHATSKCEIVTSNPVINARADGNIWFGSGPCRSLDDAKLTRSTISSCAAVEEPPATTQDDERKSD